jgi:uncharacterized membrane protein required for colicin V production
MFGLIKGISNFVGSTVGVVAGIALAPIALALNISESMVEKAVKAGCRTQREIKKWVEDNS